MRRVALLLVLALAFAAFAPGHAMAQNARLEALLEQQLSNDTRVVEIDGFAGALSAQATMQALRIADRDGVWLVLEGAQLDWNRAALLRGRLEVTSLRAERLEVIRTPVAEPSLPDAEASGFRIPDLPISINIESFAINTLELGSALLGEAASARVTASAALDDAGLRLKLDASRTDSKQGEIRLDLAFDPIEETLASIIRVEEPAGGVVATALGLPGTPALRLDVSGAGPLDAYSAEIQLATDGQERLGGRVSLQAVPGADARRFAANLAGDIRPLLAPDTREFFGPETALVVNGTRATDGALNLSQLDLRTAQLRATGSAQLSAGNTPEAALLDVVLGSGDTVQLPGTDVILAGADIALRFDANTGPDWTLTGLARDVVAGGVTIGNAVLEAQGQLNPETGTVFAGGMRLAASAVAAPADPNLTRVIGPNLRLGTNVILRDGGEITLSDLSFDSPHATGAGTLSVTPTDGRARILSDLRISTPALSPFSGLAGLPLEGAAQAALGVDAELPGGTIAVTLDGQTDALDIGQPVLEPLLSPQTELAVAVRRDEAGTRIETLSLTNPELTAEVSGSVDSGDGALRFDARLRDGAFLDPRLAGGIAVQGSVRDLRGTLGVAGSILADAGLDLTATGALAGDAAALTVSGTLDEVERFAAPLTGVAVLDGQLGLSGQHPVADVQLDVDPGISARIKGPVSGPEAILDLAVSLRDAGVFAAPLAGAASVNGTLDLTVPVPEVALNIAAQPGITANVTGPVTAADAPLSVTARVTELGQLVAALPGPATLTAEVRDITGALRVDAALNASRGIRATVAGQPLGEASALEIGVDLATLAIFVPQLPGPARLDARVEDLTGAQKVSARVAGPGIRATADGALQSGRDAIALSARLDRIDRFAPGLTGGANVVAALTGLRSTPAGTVTLTTDSGAKSDIAGTLDAANGRGDLTMTGTLPVGLASGFVGDRALSGNARFDLRLAGPLQLTSLGGQVVLSGVRLFDPGSNVTVSDLSATADVSQGVLRLNGQGVANDGTLGLSGSLGLEPPFRTDLSVRADNLIYALQSVFQTRVGAALTLQGPATRRLSVAGTVDLFDTEIRVPDTGLGGAAPIPEITHLGSSAASVRTRTRAGITTEQSANGNAGRGPVIPLDIQITARDPIFVRGRGLDAAFEGGVRLGGTAAAPTPVGQFRLQRGRLDFLGRRLTLVEGRITAAGAAIPRLRVVAESVLSDLTARIIVEGPANAPEITVTSAPERPQDEVLAQLLFGRGFDSLSPFQVAQLISSVRTLAGKGDGLVERTRAAIGLDNFDVRTDNETGVTELSFGQRVTEDVYSEIDVDSAGEVELNLNLDLSPTTRLRGSVSNDGNAGLGIFWQKDY